MRNWLYLAAILGIAAGCGNSDGGAAAGGAGGSGGTVGGGGSGGGGPLLEDGPDSGWVPQVPAALAGQMTELDRPASCGEEHGFFSAVRGWVVAPGGEPIPGAKAQLCVHAANGDFVCLKPADADAEGVYTVEVPENVRCLDRVAMRVLDPRVNRASVYCQIDPAEGPAVRLVEPSVLPVALPTVELPPEGDVDAPRKVVFDDGLELEVTPSLFYSGMGDYEELGGRRIPPEAVGLCGDAPTFDGLYAFFPEGSIDAPGFDLRIPNKDDLAAGTTVELFVLGGLDCRLLDGSSVPEAVWKKFGEAKVNAEGSAIEAEPGSALPCLTWLGYRVKE